MVQPNKNQTLSWMLKFPWSPKTVIQGQLFKPEWETLYDLNLNLMKIYDLLWRVEDQFFRLGGGFWAILCVIVGCCLPFLMKLFVFTKRKTLVYNAGWKYQHEHNPMLKWSTRTLHYELEFWLAEFDLIGILLADRVANMDLPVSALFVKWVIWKLNKRVNQNFVLQK